MALVECIECKNQVSDKAGQCPHCGVNFTQCSECGSLFANCDKFCGKCGYQNAVNAEDGHLDKAVDSSISDQERLEKELKVANGRAFELHQIARNLLSRSYTWNAWIALGLALWSFVAGPIQSVIAILVAIIAIKVPGSVMDFDLQEEIKQDSVPKVIAILAIVLSIFGGVISLMLFA